MGLKGQFNWIQSLRLGGRKAISFTLKCTNLLGDETFDAAIIDGSGASQPMYFTNQSIPARKSLRFDYDTVGWDWCQGDRFVILDKRGKIKTEWTVNMKTYAYGECPSCHGTHRCSHCSGNGRLTDKHVMSAQGLVNARLVSCQRENSQPWANLWILIQEPTLQMCLSKDELQHLIVKYMSCNLK